jgi:VIT1/CCC1 family predicted Fe2+/Mn2+ transporter
MSSMNDARAAFERRTAAVNIPDAGSPTKSAAAARDAHARGDVEASRAQHALPAHHEPHSKASGDLVKALVFGGLDGIMTTFAIVAAAAGGGADWKTVLIFGFSNKLADGWAMGFGEFVSGMAEIDHAKAERAREEWELENYPEGEIKEMEEIYQERGFTEEEAREVVAIHSKNPKIFVDVMMREELEIDVDIEDTGAPLRCALVMFFAFIGFGFLALIPYLGRTGAGMDRVFGASCGMVGLALVILGAIKGHLTGQPIPKTAVMMLLSGCTAGAASFFVSQMTRTILASTGSGAAAML